MISTKILLFALVLAMISALSASAEVETFRDLMMDDNSTSMDMMDEGGCHCMAGGMIHCDDEQDEIDCHCMGSVVHCDMMHSEVDMGMDESMGTMEMESGADSMGLVGAAIAGAMVAFAL